MVLLKRNIAYRIPKPQVDWLSVDHHIGRIIIESVKVKGTKRLQLTVVATFEASNSGKHLHCGYVFAGKGICCVTDE